MFQIGDLVMLRANKTLCGFITHIDNFTNGNFCYVSWFNHHNASSSNIPYAFTSLELVS